MTGRIIHGDATDEHFQRHPHSARFHEILGEHGRLHDRKQADYGRGGDPFANVRASEDFGVPGWIGTVMRANDKMKRLQKAAQQYLETGRIDLANESVIDSFDDLAVYATIARVLFEEESAPEQPAEPVGDVQGRPDQDGEGDVRRVLDLGGAGSSHDASVPSPELLEQRLRAIRNGEQRAVEQAERR